MYSWPIEQIRAMLDAPVKRTDPAKLGEALTAAGYGRTLVEFLAPLYEQAGGGTLYDGAFRILPLQGSKKERSPSLVDWNAPDDWKQFAPANGRNAFYFCANVFGDLFGVPLDERFEVARDRVSTLWLEKSFYEESGIGWNAIVAKLLANEDSMADYLGRLKEYTWAAGKLGKPGPRECFSWDVPPVIGGSESIKNLRIVSLPVSVSFTLQVIQQAREGGAAG